MEQYSYIKYTSHELCSNEKIGEVFLEMDTIYGEVCKSLDNIKKLDFLMWSVGKVL